jgi:hypothetical protein
LKSPSFPIFLKTYKDDGTSAAYRPRLSRHGQNDFQTKNAFYITYSLERSRWPWSAGGRLLAVVL